MRRSIWNGTITFGLIAVPIKVYSAKEGKEVPYKEVAMGYEVRGGEFVMLDKDEVDAAAGDSSHTIELEQFVDRERVDPVFYDRTYYLRAGSDGEQAYRLLREALDKAGRTGLGRWVFHHREYMVAVRAREDVLVLHTMRFADELVAAHKLDITAPSRKPTGRELDMAEQLVGSLHKSFRPSAFKDTYRDRVAELIKRKAEGEEIELPEFEEPEAPEDLMAALEASLGKGTKSRSKARS
jgi:DNA end-binding protein Ku